MSAVTFPRSICSDTRPRTLADPNHALTKRATSGGAHALGISGTSSVSGRAAAWLCRPITGRSPARARCGRSHRAGAPQGRAGPRATWATSAASLGARTQERRVLGRGSKATAPRTGPTTRGSRSRFVGNCYGVFVRPISGVAALAADTLRAEEAMISCHASPRLEDSLAGVSRGVVVSGVPRARRSRTASRRSPKEARAIRPWRRARLRRNYRHRRRRMIPFRGRPPWRSRVALRLGTVVVVTLRLGTVVVVALRRGIVVVVVAL